MNRLRLSVLSTLMLVSLNAWAAMYKHVDEHGNTVYTDQPANKEEKEFQAPDINTVKTVKPPPPGSIYKRDPLPLTTKYGKVAITSPANDAVIRGNEGKVTVSFSIDPELDTGAGHTANLVVDGKSIATDGKTHSFSNMDRGTHTATVVVIDKAGKTLAKSKPITFHVKRTTAH